MYKLKLTKTIILSTLFLAVLVLYKNNLKFKVNYVDSVAKEAKQASLECKDNKFSTQCYAEEFRKITKEYDLFFAKDVLSQVWSLDNRTLSCHFLAHKIGTYQVEKDPTSWRKLLDKIDPQFCSGGLFHGILETHARFDPDFNVKKQVDIICKDIKSSYEQGSCVHILGHILLIEVDGSVSEAVEICENIKLTTVDQCYSGVFMENMVREDLREHGIVKENFVWNKKSASEMEALCRKYNGTAAYGCWGEMGHMYAAVYDDNPSIVFRLCANAPSEEFSTNCYLHAVAKIAVTSSNQSYVNVLCKVYEGDQINLTHA